ncbi:hypothetical protein CTI12_AA459190 [Artemisia annua]|uniref:RRM domain-containing protein n=1 Tax=Artemisia annua TaxID=35608 RepID=A0A2U1KXU9_ARTAN|nr:hypothetical protein CTI12_AA459190 [Artemisia annua]
MVNGEINNGEWTTIDRRSRKQRATTTSYYFTDIPTGWNETALWKLFAKYGRISDVHLAKKKSKDGKSFGFARFLKITNPTSFEISLNSITVGTHRLTANIARYQNGVAIKPPTKPILTHYTAKPPPNQPAAPAAYKRTFSNVVNTIPTHIPPPLIPTHIPPPPTPITIHPCPDLISKLSHSLIGELYSIDTLPNLGSIFDDNGFPNIRTKYLGGLFVLLEVETETPTNMVLENTSVKSCFKTLNPWTNKFKLEDRLVWISIEGLPPQAWHEAAFSRIARSWGDIIVPETCNSTSNNLVAGKVCVRTKCMDVILHTMPILVDDSHMCIRGLNKELESGGGWIREEDEELMGHNGLSSEFDSDSVDYGKSPEYSKIQGKIQGQPSSTVESQKRNMEDEFCGTFVPDTQVLEKTEVTDKGDAGVDVATSQNLQSDRLIDSLNGVNLQNLKKKSLPIPTAHHNTTVLSTNSGSNTPLENNNDLDILIRDLRHPKVKPSTSTNRVNEITKTIEVGTSLGYNMIGKDDQFINRAELFDIPMSGRKFTRMNKFGTKLSKIDRILVSHHFITKWPNAQVLALQRELSDHCPLVLKTHSVDFGPIPFKFFNSWLLNGSLLASNLAMLTKWWWRFKSENNSLWHQVITSIFGTHGRLETNIFIPIRHSHVSPWKEIYGLNKDLLKVNINLDSIFLMKIGDGSVFKFWHDCWFGTSNFMSLFPRMYALETHKDCLISERCFSGGLMDLPSHVWAWRRSPRDGIEKAQFDDLVNLLVGFKPTDVRDSWTCSLNSLKHIHVSSMRYAIDL